jgi:serine protease Do
MKLSTHLMAALALVASTLLPLAAQEPQPAVDAAQKIDEGAPVELRTAIKFLAEPINAVTLFGLSTCSDSLIGVDVTGVDELLRSHLGLADGQGVVVTAVAGEGPAARAGIVKNDVLIMVGEQPIGGVEGLQNLLQPAVDQAVKLVLVRSGQKQSLEVTPQSPVTLSFALSEAQLAAPKYWLGVGLANADDTLRSHLGVADGEGLIVTSVENDSPAAKAGVMTNDLLLKLDGKPLTTIDLLSAQLQEIADRSTTLELLRRGKPASLTVTLEQRAPQDYATFVTQFVQQGDLGEVLFTLPQAFEAIDSVKYTDDLKAFLVSSAVQRPDVLRQVADLIEQAKQLEKALEEVKRLQQSLEALDAAIKAEGVGTGE